MPSSPLPCPGLPYDDNTRLSNSTPPRCAAPLLLPPYELAYFYLRLLLIELLRHAQEPAQHLQGGWYHRGLATEGRRG